MSESWLAGIVGGAVWATHRTAGSGWKAAGLSWRANRGMEPCRMYQRSNSRAAICVGTRNVTLEAFNTFILYFINPDDKRTGIPCLYAPPA